MPPIKPAAFLKWFWSKEGARGSRPLTVMEAAAIHKMSYAEAHRMLVKLAAGARKDVRIQRMLREQAHEEAIALAREQEERAVKLAEALAAAPPPPAPDKAHLGWFRSQRRLDMLHAQFLAQWGGEDDPVKAPWEE